MIPSLVGSAVDVRQTAGTISVVHITEDIYMHTLSVTESHDGKTVVLGSIAGNREVQGHSSP
jgi:hypothetical protein